MILNSLQRVLMVATIAAACVGSSNNAVAAQTAWPGGQWQPYPAPYGSKMDTEVSIPMSDGVTLIATVTYPTEPATGVRAEGKFPVLLAQNPYSQATLPGRTCDSLTAGALSGNEFFVTRGYIFVSVCTRGTGKSGGEFQYFGTGRVAQDGKEMVYWAADKLQSSNGSVGLIGCSYLGFTQLFTAALLPKNSPAVVDGLGRPVRTGRARAVRLPAERPLRPPRVWPDEAGRSDDRALPDRRRSVAPWGRHRQETFSLSGSTPG